MKQHLRIYLILLLLSLLSGVGVVHAQLIKDLGRQIEISNIKNLQSSATHLYVLSESEGLVVFRAYSDSLQWLYSSTGMQQRGHKLETDIRFAYLYGDSRRLTVIEPTSVLGVYSSTVLPDTPQAAKRIGNDLFIALGETGFGRINLETPESVDSGIDIISNAKTLDLATDGNQTLFALIDGGSLQIYTVREGNINLSDEVDINQKLNKLFLVEGELLGSDTEGNIFLINYDGRTQSMANVVNSVDKIDIWNDRTIVRTENADIWIDDSAGNLNRWKSGEQSGNHFTVTENAFWITEFNKVVPVTEQDTESVGTESDNLSTDFKLIEIEDVVLPYPRPLILPIEFQSNISADEVSLSYNASFNNAQIRGCSFYWQPTATQSGRHSVTITASLADGRSDSTQFIINLRPFNSPPRFTPARPITIPVGENFELQINAIDPDGMDQSLNRYLGVDMPDGARINEQTGLFAWQPTERQIGEHTFRVIATDQYGAASSQDYTINVVELSAQSGEEELFDQ